MSIVYYWLYYQYHMLQDDVMRRGVGRREMIYSTYANTVYSVGGTPARCLYLSLTNNQGDRQQRHLLP